MGNPVVWVSTHFATLACGTRYFYGTWHCTDISKFVR